MLSAPAEAPAAQKGNYLLPSMKQQYCANTVNINVLNYVVEHLYMPQTLIFSYHVQSITVTINF